MDLCNIWSNLRSNCRKSSLKQAFAAFFTFHKNPESFNPNLRLSELVASFHQLLLPHNSQIFALKTLAALAFPPHSDLNAAKVLMQLTENLHLYQNLNENFLEQGKERKKKKYREVFNPMNFRWPRSNIQLTRRTD